jgi:uncharacterized oligopeptide transporter (OPT) family protein
MHPFFVWLEATSLSTWIRESTSVWAFPTILSVHTVGMGFVAGLNAAVALRILGFAPAVPLLELRRFLPVMWAGFWANAVSGVLLLIGYPTKAFTNPMFYLKLTFIAVALVVVCCITRSVFGDPSLDLKPATRKSRILAWWSLACWTGAITAGAIAGIHLFTSDVEAMMAVQ